MTIASAAAALVLLGLPRGELQESVAQARATSERLAHALRTVPPHSTHGVYSWVGKAGAFDPLSFWRRVRQPAVVVHGGRDTQLRPRASIERLRDAVGADAENVTVLLLQGNGQALLRDDVTTMRARWTIEGGAK